jgi:hypothetical protein
MRKVIEAGPGEIPDNLGEDTIELELSPQDLLTLSRASGEANALAPRVDAMSCAESALKAVSSTAPDTPRMGRLSLARVGGVLSIAAAVIALAGAAHRAVVAPSVTAAAINPSGSPAADTTRWPAESTNSNVRIRNPFDASEVFDFPPGTSEAGARLAVSNILLRRARDRQSRSGGARGVGSHRATPDAPRDGTESTDNTGRVTH